MTSRRATQQIFEPHRVFVREGPLWKVCRKAPKKREFFLFNDLFFYASQLPTGGLFVHRVIKLVELRLADVMDTDTMKNAFQVGSTQKSFVVFAESKEEKVDWMVDLTNTMESCRKNIQSLQLENAVDTSKLSEAPVWQPDSEATCCPMCSSDFTLLNRRVCCRSHTHTHTHSCVGSSRLVCFVADCLPSHPHARLHRQTSSTTAGAAARLCAGTALRTS